MTLQALAQEARSQFETATRDDGRQYWLAKWDAPAWVKDLSREAHGRDCNGAPTMLPDDWRYLFIVEALDYLSDGGDPDDFTPEGDVYTADVLAWLGSHGMRPGYADEAAEEFGFGADTGVIERAQAGQASERREVFELVRRFLEERLESEEVAS